MPSKVRHEGSMHTRKIVRYTASAVFVLMLVPVVGDWFSELARQNGVYADPSGQVRRMVAWAQSIIGESGFFWLLFGVGGFASGLWLDVLLRRPPYVEEDRVEIIKQRIPVIVDGLSADLKLKSDWKLVNRGWQAEIHSLFVLLRKEGFATPALGHVREMREGYDEQCNFLRQIYPLIRDGQVGEAKVVSWVYQKASGEVPDVAVYLNDRKFKRRLGAKPVLRLRPGTAIEKQP